MDKINVLFFAYEFPPVQTTGSIRPLKFVKYLKNYGINPIVITTDIDSGTRVFNHAKIDNNILQEIPEEIEVIRIPTQDFSHFYNSKIKKVIHHYFSVSDHIKRNWGKNVFNKIDNIIKQYNPKVIYATAPPFGVATIASNISKKYNLPLVLDMRDHWSHWGFSAYISKLHYYATFKAEHKAFKIAKKVISVTEQVINDFRDAHPSLDKKKFEVIPNGFEHDLLDYGSIKYSSSKKKYVIGYMGEFYYFPKLHDSIFKKWYKKNLNRMFQYIPRIEDYKYRSPYYFFKTLSELFKIDPSLKEKIEFHYIGGSKDWLNEMLNKFDLMNNTVLHGRVNYTKSIELAKKFDFSLSTSIKVDNGEDYALASKTFDYLALKKPILGFVTKGAQKTFLEKSGVAFIFDPDNISESAEKLNKIIQTDTTLNYNKNFLKNYERIRSTEKLATIFKETIVEK